MTPTPRPAPLSIGASVARQLVAHAARDNAGWCDLFTRTHGIMGRTDRDAWTSPVRTPQGYPDAVTLRPGVDIAALLSRVDTASPACSVKDSYDDLDLSPHGFHELFRATWIAYPGAVAHPGADREAPIPGAPWSLVTRPEDLRAWEAGWGHRSRERFFRPELLATPGVSVLASWDGAELLAGAILTTTGAEPVVGVSNVFMAGGEVGDAWAGILAWTVAHHPGLPLVGYEAGDDLAAALDAGFQALGPLRIWMADDALDE